MILSDTSRRAIENMPSDIITDGDEFAIVQDIFAALTNADLSPKNPADALAVQKLGRALSFRHPFFSHDIER